MGKGIQFPRDLVCCICRLKTDSDSKKTDIYEGSLIRAFRLLVEVLRQMVQAAKAIGNTELENKFAAAITAIKRDIVFAPSLVYLSFAIELISSICELGGYLLLLELDCMCMTSYKSYSPDIPIKLVT
jgi:hypothetical protein